MATGFVQRWKGKVNADSLWVKGWGQSEVQPNPAAGSTLNQFGNFNINASSAAAVYTMQPVDAGVTAVIAFTNVSSAAFLKAAPGNNFGVFGGSTIIVMKSTTIMTIALRGISTVAWAIESIWSTSTSVIAQPTFSTTT